MQVSSTQKGMFRPCDCDSEKLKVSQDLSFSDRLLNLLLDGISVQ